MTGTLGRIPVPSRAPGSIVAGALAVCLTLGAGGCQLRPGQPAAEPGQERELVELFSWWSAPGEAEALEALFDVHHATHPGARIFNSTAAFGANPRDWLEERLVNDRPPDIFQEYIHDLRALPNAAEKRMPLDDLFDRLGLRAVIFPEILRDITRNGHIYSMPVNVHRENALFYNRRLLAAHHLAVPTTLDGFLTACRTLKQAGVIPVATANQGWVLRIMFNALAMGRMGSVAYRDYFMGRGPADGGGLREAIDLFADVVENYVNPDAGDEGFGWTNAAQTVVDGDAAMMLHGDWVKGYFVQLGWSGETDFGVVGAPGASEMFLYGVDGFALATGARNEAGARSLLATVASPAGQIAFNRIKGSSPIRPDVPRAELDQLGRQTLDDLEHAKIRMLMRSRPVWEEGLADFTHDHDRAKLLRVFLDNPPGA